jgi:carboxyl-terminal processing protease
MIKNIVFLLLALLSISAVQAQEQRDFEISKNLDIYAAVYNQLLLHYVDEIEVGELNKEAIVKMLASLDPYTNYYPEAEIEDVRYMRTGKYGGVGAGIHAQNDTLVVGRILKGYPFYKAGIRTGDMLLKADEQSLIGFDVSKISNILKGSAGSTFSLTYMEQKTRKVITKEIKREEVKINSVPYAGIINTNTAYIKLSQFNETAASEVAKAMQEMSAKKELSGLILDLRDNGGGLLIQAVQIMDLFLPAGKLIVETRGKVRAENKAYHTKNPALYPDLPVIVLINGNSASASEIVAGAFQDYDRGVIMGQKSYGKGLVQKVYPLSFNAQMKITVAKYYIPSGRCIQEINYLGSNKKEKVADSLRGSFKTKGGREFMDGGGIMPDVRLPRSFYAPISIDLATKHFLFNYATHYVNTHDSINDWKSFQLTSQDMVAFKKYIDKYQYTFVSPTMKKIQNLATDSVITQDDSLQVFVQHLQDQLTELQNNDLNNNLEEIQKLLEVEIVARYFFDQGRIQKGVGSDPTTEEATKLLNNKEKYSSILQVK